MTFNDATVDPTEADAIETIPNRRRLRPRHWSALGMSVLLVAGAVVFTMQATSDRDTASADRVHAQRELHTQRLATRDARTALVSTRGAMKTGSATVGQVLDSAQKLAALADQGTGAARTIQSLGAADPPSSVDDYNAATDQSNGLADQYNAMLDAITQQVAQIAKDVSAQLA